MQSDFETTVYGTYKKAYHDFQEWAFSNNVVIAASGFAIGVATKEVIEKLLDELIRPMFLVLLNFKVFKMLHQGALKYISETNLETFLRTLGTVGWSVFEWVVIIVMTFVIMEYFLNRKIIGLKSQVKDEEKKDFVKAKAEANAHDNIIATQQDVKWLEKQERLEKQAGINLAKIDQKQLEATATKKTPTENFNQNIPQGLGDSVFYHRLM
jgi:large-conductance mechanosensitive channel